MKPSVQLVCAVVAEAHNVRVEDILGRSKLDAFARPRKIAMYLARKHVGASQRRLGQLFDRTHATVSRSLSDIDQAVKAPAFAASIEQLDLAIEARSNAPKTPLETPSKEMRP